MIYGAAEDMHDDVTRASRFAIARARQQESPEVSADDLLWGLLLAASRFGVVLLGPWTIDLEEFGEAPLDETKARGAKPSYADEAVALFERAAGIARRDASPRVEIVHMLVAFADSANGMMARLRKTYGIDSATWRASLARWQPLRLVDEDGDEGSEGPAPRTVRELLSPDEAADLLGVHTQTVRGYMRSGKLTAHRLAGERALRIQRKDLLALLEPYEAG